MKINKALKVKNRLAGEISAKQDIFRRENSRRSDNVSTVDREKAFEEIVLLVDKLALLKGEISKATSEIAPKLSLQTEYKGFLNYLKSVPTRRGTEVTFVGRDQEKLAYDWTVFLTHEQQDILVSQYQEKINILQDEIDVFNATKEVAFEA